MKKEEKMKKAEILIEYILDTLIEVGNGVSDEDLHEACDILFEVRELIYGTKK